MEPLLHMLCHTFHYFMLWPGPEEKWKENVKLSTRKHDEIN